MCRFQTLEADKIISCQATAYVGLLSDQNAVTPSDLVIPIDGDGLCIFHSSKLDWKRENNFGYWLERLFKVITLVDQDKIPLQTTFRDFNLMGFVFIENQLAKQKGGEAKLSFKKLRLKNHIQLYLNGSTFVMPVSFQECRIKKTVLVFNDCRFESHLQISNCQIFQLGFTECRFSAGILISKCDIQGYTEFSGATVQESFQITSTEFTTNVFLPQARFECHSFLLSYVNFHGQVDFSASVFEQDIAIENCEFDKTLKFHNAHFQGPLELTGNIYSDNVYFTSSESQRKLFEDSVHFLILNQEEELTGHLIFENANLSNIAEQDRRELIELSRKNKVTIGPGCIKYRAQTRPVSIKSTDVNRSLISELTHSFSSYFTSTNGINLGVEFIDKTLGSLSIFYFTDEDMTNQELEQKLKFAADKFWTFDFADEDDTESIAQRIDSFAARVGVTLNIALKEQHQIWSSQMTRELVGLIPTSDTNKAVNQINITIQKFTNNMKIENLIAHSGSQINIADRIDKIDFFASVSGITETDLQKFKELIAKLTPREVTDLNVEVVESQTAQGEISLIENLKSKVVNLGSKYGIPLAESLTASAVYDLLKVLFGVTS
ncbi:hypothetical protein [Dyadobacter sp. 3J3]|uniref:hypothetical protein n=1 Tax=Dyadobacter sp. 3J3 TaxID=2606600 RepID=UPI001358C600|nr:hypothetical protein [Dyadobacter sp. 3J3]